MAQQDKASEPSMDDILASIRKIIADEPAAGKTPAGEPAESRRPFPLRDRPNDGAGLVTPKVSPAPVAAAPAAIPPQPPPAARSTAAANGHQGNGQDHNALNHMLLDEDLADLVEDMPALVGAVVAAAVSPKPAAVNVAVPPPVPPAPNRGGPLDNSPEWRLARAAPVQEAKSNGAATTLANGVNDALAMFARPPARPAPPSSIGFGIDSVPPRVPAALPEPQAMVHNRAALPPLDQRVEAKTTKVAAASATAAAPRPEYAQWDAGATPDINAGHADANAIAAVETAANIATAAALDALAASLATPAGAAKPAVTAVAASLSRVPPVAQAPAVAKAPQAMPTAGKTRPASPAAVIATPAVVAQPGAKSGGVPKPAGQAMPGIPQRSMEDTVTELLRPMLRQWLDDNLPRIVEKVLRVEVADMAGKKDGGTPQS